MTQDNRSALTVDIKSDDVIDLQGLATVELLYKSGNKCARLRITASPDIRIKILREEPKKKG